MSGPKVLYVCECCFENAPEGCGRHEPSELRLSPDGRQLCDNCYPEEVGDDGPPFSEAPRLPADTLLGALKQAAPEFCSNKCPSVGKAGTPIPHLPECIAMTDAIARFGGF